MTPNTQTLSTLKRALSAISDAYTALRRAKDDAEDDHDIRRAMSELDDAERHVKKAIADLKAM